LCPKRRHSARVKRSSSTRSFIPSGKRLFEEEGDPMAPELVDSRIFPKGVVYLTYRPASEGDDLDTPRTRTVGRRKLQNNGLLHDRVPIP
jgi:hypothetical protein